MDEVDSVNLICRTVTLKYFINFFLTFLLLQMRYLDENIKCLWSNLKKAKKPFFLLCGPEVQNCLHGESYLLIKKRNLEDNEENALTFTSMDVLACKFLYAYPSLYNMKTTM